MSDAEDNVKAIASSEKPLFTPKEEAIMKIAWRCLKSGPPEIDMDKLKELGGFNTVKTTSNTWGAIKKKLFVNAAPNGGSAAAENGSEPGTPSKRATAKTKKGTATPSKRTKKVAQFDDDDDEDGEVTTLSRKKARVSPVKGNVDDEI